MGNKKTVMAGLAALAAAGMGLSVAPGVAQAADEGQRTGPVQFWAEDLGDCKVKFTLYNETNITSYTVDYITDDTQSELRTTSAAPFPYGRIAGNTIADSPAWPDDIPTMGQNEPGNIWMVKDRTPGKTATYVKDLKNLTDNYNPPLPNPDAATHKISYRMVLGPAGNLGDGGPEWIGDRQWHHMTVTGCAAEDGGGDNGGGDNGGGGDVGGGSLGGLFG